MRIKRVLQSKGGRKSRIWISPAGFKSPGRRGAIVWNNKLREKKNKELIALAVKNQIMWNDLMIQFFLIMRMKILDRHG